LCLFYSGRFVEGREQFSLDTALNGGDAEEVLWCFLCDAQRVGVVGARGGMLELLEEDPRPVLRVILSVYRGEVPLSALHEHVYGPCASAHDKFYAALYEGLFHEALGAGELARDCILAALRTPYAEASQDYMVAVGRMHAHVRGWRE